MGSSSNPEYGSYTNHALDIYRTLVSFNMPWKNKWEVSTLKQRTKFTNNNLSKEYPPIQVIRDNVPIYVT